ncbi:DNA-binding response regulator [Paenibacillus sp. H1-7]|uniref:response regulator transcription factor n=1 Tax=Paenibacillus sp. H1-7 TaxID=2282849 RepID=UPI001EF80C06|nr:response regulator transcription factor [Paenibacillus sp. H1-7]ULL14078.1 DNA-binding response regulator [Paenibacillus sp. H1-7]
MSKTVLVVDDEDKIRDVVVSYLQQEGFLTIEAATGAEALHLLGTSEPEMIILDLMLPDLSGEEVCRRIRQTSPIPILMLTAKITEDDRIQGLTLGADDYVLKPFSPRELVARVKAIFRRTQEDSLLAERISFGQDELVIDCSQHEIYKRGTQINVTPNEYKLLLVLARHPGRYFSREELVEKVLGFDFEGDSRTIDQHIKNLRQKIEKDPKQPQFIVTVYGVGYRFDGGARP